MADVDLPAAGDGVPPCVCKKGDEIEPGTRRRRVVSAPFFVGRRFERILRFGHFAFKIECQQPKGPSMYSSLKVVSCLPGAEFEFTQDSLPWELDVGMTILSGVDDEVLHKEVRLRLHNAYPATGYGIQHLKGKQIRVQLELYSCEGFELKPLRDYSVANKSSDVVFVVEEKKFHLNKEVLARNSPVFHKMLFGEFDEKNKKEIQLNDVSADAFTSLLDILDGHVFVPDSMEPLFAVLKLVDEFDFPSLLATIQHTLLLYPDMGSMGRAQRLCLAEKYKMNTLLNQCIADWQPEKGPEIRMTREMMDNQLSANTRWLLFQKLHPRNHPHTHHPDKSAEELEYMAEYDSGDEDGHIYH